MLCDLCHEREAVTHLSTTTSAEPLRTGPKMKGLTPEKLMTSGFSELLGIAPKHRREKHYCEQCALSPGAQEEESSIAANKRAQTWKQVEDSTAAVSFYLTGESVVRAVTLPSPPGSKSPAIVRITHSNCYGPVDSDVFVRLGNPKKPLDVQDFDTVSDWRKAKLVEDLIDDEDKGWKPRGKAKATGSYWSGTYEVEIQFSKGQHQIELKIISRVEQVCSIVLSNWKVNVR
jgi:hypothetical protein